MAFIHPDDGGDGPVVKVTAANVQARPPSKEDQLRAEANELLTKASAADCRDRRLARGYRARARALLDQLDDQPNTTTR